MLGSFSRAASAPSAESVAAPPAVSSQTAAPQLRPIKITYGGQLRKVQIDVSSMATMERAVAGFLGIPVAELSLEYVDEEKEVVALPSNASQEEFEGFRDGSGSLRLIAKRITAPVKEVALPLPQAEAPAEVTQSHVPTPTFSVPEKASSSSSSSSSSLPSNDQENEEDENLDQMYEDGEASKAAANQDTTSEAGSDACGGEGRPCVSLFKLLANRQFVEDVQVALSNPAVADLVVSLANAFGGEFNSNGSQPTPSVIEVLFSQGPAVFGVFNQVIEKYPEVKEVLGEDLIERGIRKGIKLCQRHHRHERKHHRHHHHHHHGHHDDHHHHHHGHHGPHHHHHGPHHGPHHHHFPPHHGHDHRHFPFPPHGPHGHHPHHGPHHSMGFPPFPFAPQAFPHVPPPPPPRHGSAHPIHYNVVCDGCETSENLRQASIEQGFTSPEGYIAGIRFKSAKVDDYDLCESCEASEIFQNSHGPFVKFVEPNHIPFEFLMARRRQQHCREMPEACRVRAVQPEVVPAPKVQESTSSTSEKPQVVDKKAQKAEQLEKLMKEGLSIFENLKRAGSASASEPPAKAAQVEPKQSDSNEGIPEKWRGKIELLKTLGFVEWTKYLSILEEENGELESVIARILTTNSNNNSTA